MMMGSADYRLSGITTAVHAVSDTSKCEVSESRWTLHKTYTFSLSTLFHFLCGVV